MKLRSRLALMALLALVPLLIFSALAAKRLSDGTRLNAFRAMQETANTAALIIDRELQGSVSTISVLAKSPLLIQEDFEQFYHQAKSSVASENGWVILYTPSGSQVLNTRMPYGAALLTRPTPEELPRILSAQSIHISGMTWSRNLKKHLIFIDIPVSTRSGNRYVLSHVLYASHFSKTFREMDIPLSWFIGIFDREGISIGRSTDAEKYAGSRASPETVEAIRVHKNVVRRHIIRGHIDVYDALTFSALSGWAVAVAVPVGEIDGKVREAAYITAGGLLMAFIAALAGAGLVGRKLAGSIEKAAAAAELLGTNEPLPMMGSSGTQEIDGLHQALVNAETKLKTTEALNADLLESERAARKLAEVENKRKDEFLAMLGHELRNPLSAVTSGISLLRLRVGDEPALKRPLDIVHRQSEHLRSLLNDLLDLSRIIYGKVQLELEPVALGELVTASIRTMQDTSKLSKHQLSLETQPLMVHGDRTRLEQIFSNLIDNAVKYTPEGGNIWVSVVQDGSSAVIRVADSGAGIDPELLPFIFDVFVQGDKSLARTTGGMGIGLGLVQRLVTKHGGTVTATSDGVGKGSCFEIRLPRWEGGAVSAAGERSDTTGRNLAGIRLLLVEDQDDLREMSQTLLGEAGLEVVGAACAKDALDIAPEFKPQIAVLDIGLPDISGYELAALLRSLPDLETLHLIALTGYGLDSDKLRSAAAGFDAHLTKPLDIEEILECVADLVSKESGFSHM